MRTTACLLLSCFSVLVGCTLESRDCPAFGSDRAERWSTGFNEGDAIEFVAQTGVTQTLLLDTRQDSLPHTTTDRFEPVCTLTSVRRYVFADSDASLLITLTERNAENPDELEQDFYIDLRPESPIGETLPLPAAFFFSVAPRGQQFILGEFNFAPPDPIVQRTLDTFLVNGNADGYSAEQEYRDASIVANAFAEVAIDSNSPAAITRVVVAEGGPNQSATSNGEVFKGGLIQFETVNGEIFTRQ